MPDLPAHTSPGLPPLYTPQPQSPSRHGFDFATSDSAVGEGTARSPGPRAAQHRGSDPPPSIISPAFTPPATPGVSTPSQPRRPPRSIPVDTSLSSSSPRPELLEKLPVVECEVRARIPTTTGHEMWLHVYRNNIDTKEHLAIVFGNQIRSRSLDAERPGETELDRMTRGAYVGRLFPGRTSSRIEAIKRSEGVPSKRRPDPSPSDPDTALLSPSSASSESGDAHTPTSDLPLVRIHSECYTGETVWSARCDCGEQLDEGARLMADPLFSPAGGAIIYLRQEGRGIGLGEKLKAYNLQDLGNDTYEANVLLRHPADARSYGLATAMLMDLGLGGERGIRLLTNNPDKVRAVEGPAREVVVRERVAMVPLAWKTGGKQGIRSEEVEKYLSTKVCWRCFWGWGLGVCALLTIRRLRSLSICWIKSRPCITTFTHTHTYTSHAYRSAPRRWCWMTVSSAVDVAKIPMRIPFPVASPSRAHALPLRAHMRYAYLPMVLECE